MAVKKSVAKKASVKKAVKKAVKKVVTKTVNKGAANTVAGSEAGLVVLNGPLLQFLVKLATDASLRKAFDESPEQVLRSVKPALSEKAIASLLEQKATKVRNDITKNQQTTGPGGNG